MVVMTESWNEQRLDDLNAGVKGLRTETHAGFAQLRTEMQAGDNQLRAEMNAGFGQLRAEIAGLNRTIIQVGGGLIGTVIVATTTIVIAIVP